MYTKILIFRYCVDGKFLKEFYEKKLYKLVNILKLLVIMIFYIPLILMLSIFEL